jgi:hypothetical protein
MAFRISFTPDSKIRGLRLDSPDRDLVTVVIFLGHPRIEATLTGALGAVIFALPALRNALPGAPLRRKGRHAHLPMSRARQRRRVHALRLRLGEERPEVQNAFRMTRALLLVVVVLPVLAP